MKDLLIDRILKAPPINEFITPGSTPVVAFGDPIKARVATIGINPAAQEFLDSKGNLLAESRRRLADFKSLGIENYAEINRSLAETVLKESNSYFIRSESVYRWFNTLEQYVLQPIGYSYKDSTAVHLDLVQWSTDPVWGNIRDSEARNLLIKDDIVFLAEMLRTGGYNTVFMNGSTVVAALEEYGLVDIKKVGLTPIGNKGRQSTLWKGKVVGTESVCLGWGLNLQHSQTTTENKEILLQWISDNVLQ